MPGQPSSTFVSAPPKLRSAWVGAISPRLILAGIVMIGLAIIYIFSPVQHAWYPQCMFHRLTGWWCPGCGVLRATHELLHGHLAPAVRFNILYCAALPLALLRAVQYQAAKCSGVPFRTLPNGWLYCGMIIAVVFTVLRNLPFARAAWLAP